MIENIYLTNVLWPDVLLEMLLYTATAQTIGIMEKFNKAF